MLAQTSSLDLLHASFVFEGLGFVIGFVLAIKIYQKDPTYLGNKLLAVANLGIATYLGSILFYDLVAQEWAIQVFLRVGLVSIMVAAAYIFFAFQVVVHSSHWWKKKRTIYLLHGLIAVYAAWIALADFITVVALEPVVDSTMDLPELVVLVVVVLGLLFHTAWDLYDVGIKNAIGAMRDKMKLVFTGLCVIIGNIFVNVASMLAGPVVGPYLDLAFFALFSVGLVFMYIGFTRDIQKSAE
jgi:hypothetical protein